MRYAHIQTHIMSTGEWVDESHQGIRGGGGSCLSLLTRRIAGLRLALTVQQDPIWMKTKLATTASQVSQQVKARTPRQMVCLIPGTHAGRREPTTRSCLWLSSAYCGMCAPTQIKNSNKNNNNNNNKRGTLWFSKRIKLCLSCKAEDTMEMLGKKQGKFYSSFLPLMRQFLKLEVI